MTFTLVGLKFDPKMLGQGSHKVCDEGPTSFYSVQSVALVD